MQDAEAAGRMLLQTWSLMFVWLSILIGGKKGIKEHGLLKWLAIYVRVNCSDLGEGLGAYCKGQDLKQLLCSYGFSRNCL